MNFERVYSFLEICSVYDLMYIVTCSIHCTMLYSPLYIILSRYDGCAEVTTGNATRGFVKFGPEVQRWLVVGGMPNSRRSYTGPA